MSWETHVGSPRRGTAGDHSHAPATNGINVHEKEFYEKLKVGTSTLEKTC